MLTERFRIIGSPVFRNPRSERQLAEHGRQQAFLIMLLVGCALFLYAVIL